ncbi:MAG: hypothetical protein FD174_1056 [Geobacteraceae bacterium]|nr:MAG: hypothetical protein FD174_1056 [Geobacteraceae bacterium]
MHRNTLIKVRFLRLVPVVAVLALSGCGKGLLGGQLLSPEIIKVTVPTETVKPAIKEAPPEKPADNSPILPPAPSKPAPPQSRQDSRSDEVESRNVIAPTVPPDISYRDETLTEDVTWHGEVLVEGSVTVAPQATLTIEAGTVVRFRAGPADSGSGGVLLVQGRIQANGSNEKPVLFASNFEEPQAGDWQGIVLLASEKKNLLEHCRVEGAETGLDASFAHITMKNTLFVKCRTGARLQDSLLVMVGCGASNCAIGLSLFDCEADIRDASFSSNRKGISAVRTSLYLAGSTLYGNDFEAVAAENSRVKIVGNSFTLNGSGASLTGCEGAVSLNRILKNTDYGLLLARSRVKANGNEIAQNGKIGLQVEEGNSVAWGNILFSNGTYDLYNAGNGEFRAIGNWWGEGTLAHIGKRIYDQRMDNGRGRVLYMPVLKERPATVQ